MRLVYVIPLAIFLFIMGLGGYMLTQPKDEAIPSQMVNKALPEFDLEPATDGVEGASRADFIGGGPRLLNLWASWCGPCRAEIPNMKAQLEAYGDRGFTIVGVNLDNSMQDYQRIVQQEELSWVNLMSLKEEERGWNHPLAVHYGISGIPTAILVDKEGKVVSMTARGGELNRLLALLLGEAYGKSGAGE